MQGAQGGGFGVQFRDFGPLGDQVGGDFGAERVEFGGADYHRDLEGGVARSLVAGDGGFEVDQQGFVPLEGGLEAGGNIGGRGVVRSGAGGTVMLDR